MKPLDADLFRLTAAALSCPRLETVAMVSGLGAQLAPEDPEELELVRWLGAEACLELEGTYHALFSGEVPVSPYETEYGLNRTTRKALELADIAGFYRAFGMKLSRPDMVDHLAIELDFLALLIFKSLYARHKGWGERAEIAETAYREFLESHAGRWVEAFAERLETLAPGGFYSRAARLAQRVITREVARLGLSPSPVGRYQELEREFPDACGACAGTV